MSEISSLSSLYPLARQPYQTATGAVTPVDPASRELKLARQLEDRLNQRIAQIRRQVSPSIQSVTPEIGSLLDISA